MKIIFRLILLNDIIIIIIAFYIKIYYHNYISLSTQTLNNIEKSQIPQYQNNKSVWSYEFLKISLFYYETITKISIFLINIINIII
jgi:hypothetical protein